MTDSGVGGGAVHISYNPYMSDNLPHLDTRNTVVCVVNCPIILMSTATCRAHVRSHPRVCDHFKGKAKLSS